ncbi:tRNA (adenosine(37)-N6)-threonylcarbamoyltransferase complex dimerization subunit type 1 TsaB [Sphingomicrobium sp. XHP0235]|uniref:tRNA (adenosine(37)-N6)-threonylcarbamoyltransferase complex dimerization subunit type 1 TsaB n=1 Tax=Sphingomicrobium aquimarinum TaxID=3133971 RepID=UPI0031FF09AD
MILAIETSTGMCSAALIDGDVLVDTREERLGRGHAERLVPLIDDLLDDRIPARILVSVGPGSFTGIRVGIAAAQGLSIGWQVPLHGFSSLAVIAATALAEREVEGVTAVMQGGHGEVFVQGFDAKGHPSGAAQSLPPEHAARDHDRPLLAGPAAQALADAGAGGEVMILDPLARNARLLGESAARLDPAPLYVRPPDAKPKAA